MFRNIVSTILHVFYCIKGTIWISIFYVGGKTLPKNKTELIMNSKEG